MIESGGESRPHPLHWRLGTPSRWSEFRDAAFETLDYSHCKAASVELLSRKRSKAMDLQLPGFTDC
jgi:hypothetical protein